MRTRMSAWLLTLLLGGSLLAARPAHADNGVVAVGGEMLFTIRAASSGMSAPERAAAVTDRLAVILGAPTISPEDIRLVPQKDKTVMILVQDRLLVTVTPEDGRPNGKTSRQQAETWARQLRQELPMINARPNPTLRNP